jgi:hypothetical protein
VYLGQGLEWSKSRKRDRTEIENRISLSQGLSDRYCLDQRIITTGVRAIVYSLLDAAYEDAKNKPRYEVEHLVSFAGRIAGEYGIDITNKVNMIVTRYLSQARKMVEHPDRLCDNSPDNRYNDVSLLLGFIKRFADKHDIYAGISGFISKNFQPYLQTAFSASQ